MKYAVIVVGAEERVAHHERRTRRRAATTSTTASAAVERACGASSRASRNSVVREREFGARSGVVGRLPGVDAAPEAERVVQERLQQSARAAGCGRRRCSRSRWTPSRPGSAGISPGPGSALAMLSRFFSSIAVTEFSFSSAGASSFSLSATSPVSCWATRRGVGQQVRRSPSGARSSTPSRSLALRISVFTCWLRSRQDAGDVGGALEQVAPASRCGSLSDLRQPGQPVEGRAQLRCDLVDGVRQRVQRLVERRGVGARGVGGEVADGVGQRVRRRGARQRE